MLPQRWLLLATSAHGLLTSQCGSGNDCFCPWTPLKQLQSVITCEGDLRGVHGIWRNDTMTAESDFLGWSGPHACIDQYCVYSNAEYAGRGIAVITTAQNFPLLKNLTQVNTPTEVQETKDSSQLYRVNPIPGKGLGMLATKDLHRGDTLMQEPLLLLVHEKLITQPPSSPKQQHLLDLAIASLPHHSQTQLLSQAGHSVNEILRTNSFQVDVGGADGFHYGNYPRAARFNHDCRPNVAYYIDDELVFHATVVRTVKQGEELTISYLDSKQPQRMRQKLARDMWGFECTCPQCSLSSRGILESDMQLSQIQSIERLLKRGSTWVTLYMIRRLVDLYQKERLEHLMADGLTLAALNANMLGDEDAAREFARMAVEAGVIEGGETRDVMVMREMVRDPRGHGSWGVRVQEKGE